MAHVIDCRGLACPQPVIRTKGALASGEGEVTVIVDNETSANNVSGMARKAGWSVDQQGREDGIYLHIRQGAPTPQRVDAPEPARPQASGVSGPTVLYVKSDRMGMGDDELGTVLIRAFFHTLLETEALPSTVIFVNSGVKLSVRGSSVLEDLQELSQRGVEILSCGTCLDFFGLMDQLAVGTVSNMYTIAETLLDAGKVLAP